jgi:hypothetical protein
MPLRRFFFSLAALTMASSPSAFAQANQPQDDEIVVVGQRLDEIVGQFVSELAAAPLGEDQLARWDANICPGIYGLTDVDTAQGLLDRIAVRAYGLDLNVGEPGCSPNISIFFTDDPQRLAAALRTRFERVLNAPNISMMGRREMTAFVNATSPVRWWSIASTRSRSGFDILDDGVVRDLSPSRLRRLTRQDLSSIVIVVDSRTIDGLRVGSLGDYLAMVSLAQINSDADTTGMSTILNLFRGGASEMTAWDLAYLEGLYGATRAARSSNQQEGQIERTMIEELEAERDETP